MTACAAALVAVPLLSGCGGGVATEPTVAIKRDKSGAAPAADGGAQANGAPAATGTPAAAGGGGVGSWKGKVVFEGTPPALKPLHEKGAPVRDPEVCAAETLPDERILVNDGGVANVFIFLPKVPAGASASPPPSEEVIFDQKNCKFIPHAVLLRAGQKLMIKTSDTVAHNTHTFPKRNTAFSQTIPASGVPITYSKPEAEPIEVKCDFHTWMIAYHFPIDHQFAALSGADGTFEIKDLPAGEHKFRVWHEGCDGKYLSRSLSVTIKPGEETTLDIPYPSSKLAVK
jgi:hypothetical protein